MDLTGYRQRERVEPTAVCDDATLESFLPPGYAPTIVWRLTRSPLRPQCPTVCCQRWPSVHSAIWRALQIYLRGALTDLVTQTGPHTAALGSPSIVPEANTISGPDCIDAFPAMFRGIWPYNGLIVQLPYARAGSQQKNLSSTTTRDKRRTVYRYFRKSSLIHICVTPPGRLVASRGAAPIPRRSDTHISGVLRLRRLQ